MKRIEDQMMIVNNLEAWSFISSKPSIIMPNDMPIDHLHLHSFEILHRLQFSLAIGSSPPLPPRFHRWNIIIRSCCNPNTL